MQAFCNDAPTRRFSRLFQVQASDGSVLAYAGVDVVEAVVVSCTWCKQYRGLCDVALRLSELAAKKWQCVARDRTRWVLVARVEDACGEHLRLGVVCSSARNDRDERLGHVNQEPLPAAGIARHHAP